MLLHAYLKAGTWISNIIYVQLMEECIDVFQIVSPSYAPHTYRIKYALILCSNWLTIEWKLFPPYSFFHTLLQLQDSQKKYANYMVISNINITNCKATRELWRFLARRTESKASCIYTHIIYKWMHISSKTPSPDARLPTAYICYSVRLKSALSFPWGWYHVS